MKLSTKILILVAVCAVCAVPLAITSGAAAHGKAHTHSSATAPNGKAYGKICLSKGLSKKHVKGEKGTLFSQCVTAMAHAAKSSTTTPSEACASMTKKHISGIKGTPFSDCVAAAKVVKATKS